MGNHWVDTHGVCSFYFAYSFEVFVIVIKPSTFVFANFLSHKLRVSVFGGGGENVSWVEYMRLREGKRGRGRRKRRRRGEREEEERERERNKARPY